MNGRLRKDEMGVRNGRGGAQSIKQAEVVEEKHSGVLIPPG